MTISRETWVLETRARIMVVSSHRAERARKVLAVNNPDSMLVARRVVVSLVAKKERKTLKTTRKISAPVGPDRPEVRIVAVRIVS
jgi:hypothetical protein